MTALYGIIGWPLGHTMSPTLHNWGFDQLGLDARYEAWPVEPVNLPIFMDGVRETPIPGLSVTIPHKQTIIDHLDAITDTAAYVGAVNTLYWIGDRLHGDNTDVIGFTAPLRKLDVRPTSALVLGAGGAARAVITGLLELGISRVAVTNRTQATAKELADDFRIDFQDWDSRMDSSWGIVCNTTPLGMSGDLEQFSPWDKNAFTPGMVAYDIVYNPLQTQFLAQAEAAGCQTISGLEMFLHQGLAQFRLWTGQDLDESAARHMLLDALRD